MRTVKLHIIIFLLTIGLAFSQDPQFSQYYASPMYLNPALTGSMELTGRGSVNFRNQWTTLSGSYVSTMAAFDYKLAKQKSAVGAFFMNDNGGVGNLSTSAATLSYAYHLDINEDWKLKSGLQLQYVFRSVKPNDLFFADELNSGMPTAEVLPKTTVSYADANAGIVLHNEDFWLGISAHHLAMPSYSFYTQKTKVPLKLSLQTGYKFHTIYATDQRESYFSPMLMFKMQGITNQADAGVILHHGYLLTGAWYRGIPLKGFNNNDALVLMAGVTAFNFNFAYSLDLAVSNIRNYSRLTHEISLVFQFEKQNSNGRRTSRKQYYPFPRF